MDSIGVDNIYIYIYTEMSPNLTPTNHEAETCMFHL